MLDIFARSFIEASRFNQYIRNDFDTWRVLNKTAGKDRQESRFLTRKWFGI